MAFGWSGAAAGASDALQEVLTRKLLEKRQADQLALQQAELQQRTAAQQQQAAAQSAAMGQRTAEFEYGKTRDAAADTRLAQQDDIKAADRRQIQNQQGVRRMIGDFVVQRGAQPLDAGARQTMQGMAVQEGIELPNELTTDPNKAQQDRVALAELQHKFQLGEIGAQGAEARRTAAAKTEPAEGPSPYMAERNVRNMQSVDELSKKVNNMTTGAGSLLAHLPATEARNFKAELDTLKANIAFGELTAMREASKTGGALGQVSDRELVLLSATLGGLDTGQSPANFKAQLQKVKDSLNRWDAAARAMGSPVAPGTSTQINPGAAQRGEFKILSVEP